MKRSTYKAFTLIEMLIVMGILVILMVVGVAAGRFAIDRANQIAHQNGATQLYQALQSHFTDYGKFPAGLPGNSAPTLHEMTDIKDGSVNSLGKYLDMGSFKGGSEADYFYFVNTTKQSVIVCVTLGGYEDISEKGISCVGNGFNDDTLGDGNTAASFVITKEYYDAKLTADEPMITNITGWTNVSQWDGKDWI